MNFAPRITFFLLSLTGVLYVKPPIEWLSRQSLEHSFSTTLATLDRLSLTLQELATVITG
jgi:hypothetical protein